MFRSEVLKRVEGTELAHKLQIIHGDALKVAFPFFDVCVANIPYNISSPLLFKLLKHRPMYRTSVIMFQEEFAMRLTAQPGDELYCRLSVNTQLLARVDHLMKVPRCATTILVVRMLTIWMLSQVGRNNFRPPPKVDSRVVRITLRNPPPPINFIEWDGLVRLLFNRKHKTIHALLTNKATLKMLESNYKTFKSVSGEEGVQMDESVAAEEPAKFSAPSKEDLNQVKEVVEEVCLLPEFHEVRAAKMDQDDILALLSAFNSRGIHFS